MSVVRIVTQHPTTTAVFLLLLQFDTSLSGSNTVEGSKPGFPSTELVMSSYRLEEEQLFTFSCIIMDEKFIVKQESSIVMQTGIVCAIPIPIT